MVFGELTVVGSLCKTGLDDAKPNNIQ